MLREIQSLPTVHRGDVFWCPVKEITDEGEYIETKTRPILVVSNEKANTFSGQVTVVPITSKEKKSLPTHVAVECGQISGIALCEWIQRESKADFGTYCGTLDAETMRNIDAALKIQLALDGKPVTASVAYAPPSADKGNELSVALLAKERDMYKALYEQLLKATLVVKAKREGA